MQSDYSEWISNWVSRINFCMVPIIEVYSYLHWVSDYMLILVRMGS